MYVRRKANSRKLIADKQKKANTAHTFQGNFSKHIYRWICAVDSTRSTQSPSSAGSTRRVAAGGDRRTSHVLPAFSVGVVSPYICD
jgi:hypothetical protein